MPISKPSGAFTGNTFSGGIDVYVWQALLHTGLVSCVVCGQRLFHDTDGTGPCHCYYVYHRRQALSRMRVDDFHALVMPQSRRQLRVILGHTMQACRGWSCVHSIVSQTHHKVVVVYGPGRRLVLYPRTGKFSRAGRQVGFISPTELRDKLMLFLNAPQFLLGIRGCGYLQIDMRSVARHLRRRSRGGNEDETWTVPQRGDHDR